MGDGGNQCDWSRCLGAASAEVVVGESVGELAKIVLGGFRLLKEDGGALAEAA